MRTTGSDLRGLALLALLAAGPGLVGSARAAAEADTVRSGPASDAVSSSIRFYQRYLSAVRHVRCRFEPSCSQYALDAIAAHGLLAGVSRSADRLMRCNASASSHYARAADGRLLDPARGETPDPTAIRAPTWLLPAERTRATACLAAQDSEDGDRSRPGETFAFGVTLAAAGDCRRAETEFLRAAFLDGTPSALVCAHRASGRCWFESSFWVEAEERYLAAAMLDSQDRGDDIHRAAVCRFNAGDPDGAAGILDEFGPVPGLVASTDPDPPAALDSADEARSLGLVGLCRMRRGRWDEAQSNFERAVQVTPDLSLARRFESLAAAAAHGPDVPRARPGLASGLSAVVPGSGQVYAGRTRDGVRTLLVNGALIWTVVALAGDGYVPAAFVVGGIALPFYVGNVVGAGESARALNRTRRTEYLTQSLEAVER